MKKIIILISMLLFSNIVSADDSLITYSKATDFLYGQNGQTKSARVASLYFLKLAEEGYPMAQYMLGNLYLKGEGVAKDMDKAVMWFYLSANQHFLPAIKKLSKIKEKSSFRALDLESVAVIH